MKNKLLILAAALALAACGGNPQKKVVETLSEVAADMHTAETSLDYTGVYKGTTPAADCPGIEVTLTLYADGTYAEHDKYIDRDSEFNEAGKYTVEDNLLTLNPADGQSSAYYKVEENRLRRLDADKQPIQGELADSYVLHKIVE